MGLPSKTVTVSNICLKYKTEIVFNAKKIDPSLKIIFQVLQVTWYISYLFCLIFLLNIKLHPIMTITQCQKDLNFQSSFFNFQISETSPEKVLSVLKDLKPSKVAGIDNLPGKFLKDGTHVLARSISQLCNLSIKLNSFPRSCKIAKVKPIFKKGSKTDPQTTALFHFSPCY